MNRLREVNDQIDESVSGIVRRFRVEGGAVRMVVLLILAFGFFTLMKPKIFTDALNLQNIGLAVPEIGVLALAMTVAMLSGGIDLSVVGIVDGAAIAMSLAFQAMQSIMGPAADGAWPVIILVGLAVGLLGGAINGLLIAFARITPILATLATMQIWNGLAIVVTNGNVMSKFPAPMAAMGQLAVIGVPLIFFMFVVIALVMGAVLSWTALGRRIAMQGANPVASRYSGIDSRRTLMTTYLISGLLAGVAAVLIVMRNPSASADYFQSYTLLVIVIAVLGGTNPNGGFATVLGVVLAALTLQVVKSGFTAMRLSPYLYSIAQGAILIIIMIIDQTDFRRLFRRRAALSPQPDAQDAVTQETNPQ